MKWLRGIAIFLSIAVLAPQALTQGQTVYSENFESGAAGWTFSGTGSFEWHVANAGECAGAATKMLAHNQGSPSCLYMYGGTHNANAYSHPPGQGFTLTGQAPYTLTFSYLRSIDPTGDSTSVTIENLTLGTSNQLTLVPPMANTSGPTPVQTSGIFPASAQAGHLVRLKFNFSANQVGNQGFGLLIDNVVVTNSSPPPTPPTVSLVTPDHGNNGSIAQVTITGSNFSGATDVKFGGVSIPLFDVINSTTIEVELPATSLTSWVDVAVTTPNGTGTLAAAYDYFAPPVQIGAPCGPASLTWSGAPCLGQTYTLTTVGLPSSNQTLLIDYSNVPPPTCGGAPWHCRFKVFPILLTCNPPYCGIVLSAVDQALNLTSPSYAFNIPNDPSLLGVQYSTQAKYMESGCPRSTQAWKATIGN